MCTPSCKGCSVWLVVAGDSLSHCACRRVEVKKAWAVHLAEQQQKQQQGSDAEQEEEAQDSETSPADAAEVPNMPPTITNTACAVSCLLLLGYFTCCCCLQCI